LINRRFLTAAGVLCVFSLHAWAGTVAVTSYNYTNSTPNGDAPYTDSGGLLTDGVLGSLNPSDGKWVLFQNTLVPEVTFNFGSSFTVTNVGIYMFSSSQANTTLPEFVSINGVGASSADTIGSDPGAAFINYSGSWDGSSLVLDLGHLGNHWIGLSEVVFTGTQDATGAPEPGTFVLLGSALLGFGGYRFRRLMCRV
jgi:PEP-CTERM motif